MRAIPPASDAITKALGTTQNELLAQQCQPEPLLFRHGQLEG